MRNPMFNNQHIKEYLLYGLFAAIAYTIPVLIFLYDNKYENFYFVYLGNLLFMFVILLYNVRLLSRPYEGKRSVSMLIEGAFTTITGVAFSCLLTTISILCFFPDLISHTDANRVIQNAPETIAVNKPGELLFMILVDAIIANFGVGVFMAVIIAYAGKKDQRTDKTESLDFNIPTKEPRNII